MLVVGESMNKIYTANRSNVINIEYGLERLKGEAQRENWQRAKKLHIHLISGVVCRKEALEIYPRFNKVSKPIFDKDWDHLTKSPYFLENKISLGKRRGTCSCRCSLEYIADEVLYGGGFPKVKPNPFLGLRQEEDYGYRFDGEDPVKAKLPPFVFSTSQKLIKEA